MDLTSPKIIKELFLKHEARASKRLGQNFLIDKNVLHKIISAADLKPDDIVLEVGPGIGTLTQELAKNVKKVFAIEKDKAMVKILSETLSDFKNINLAQEDILKLNLGNVNATAQLLPRFKYKIVANIPYYLTSPLIRKFLEVKNQPKLMVLMVQKEVAQRICAKPPDMNLLAVSVQFYAEPKIISYVSKNCFWPAPKVDSAIIKITPENVGHPMSHKFVGHRVSPELFFKIVKAGFSQPRKQLAGNLSKVLKLNKKDVETWLSKNNIKPTQRAETLSIEDWVRIVNQF